MQSQQWLFSPLFLKMTKPRIVTAQIHRQPHPPLNCPLFILNFSPSTNCKIWDFYPFLQRSGTWHFLQRPHQSPILCGLQREKKNQDLKKKKKKAYFLKANATSHSWDEHLNRDCLLSLLTCEVENFRPLLADVHTNVSTSYSQVGSTLIKHKGFHLKQETSWTR